ncbi:MAG: helix-turn-helix domain-containing protein [Actinomycetota bacterium]
MADKEKIELLRGQGVLNTDAQSVKDPLFKNNAFFDPHDLLQVKYEMIRQVESEGRSVTDASESFGFSRPSFYQAKNSFEDEGVLGLVPKKRGPRHRHKLTEEVLSFVNLRLGQDIAPEIEDIACEIKEKFSVTIHPRSIRRALKDVKKTKKAGRKK